jgi:hypothetical protein
VTREDSPPERGREELCCKAKGRRSKSLLINCPTSYLLVTRRLVTVMLNSHVTEFSTFETKKFEIN